MPSPRLLSDRSDPAVQRLVDLAKPSPALRLVLIDDVEPVTQSLTAGVEFVEVYGLEAHGVPDALLELAEAKGVPVRLVSTELAGKIFTVEKRSKVFGVARIPAPSTFDDVVQAPGDVVVLDGVKIVGNIGAITRTAFALGAAGIVLVDSDLTSVSDRRLIRASRGYVFSLPVVLASRAEALALMAESDLRVVSFDLDGTLSVDDLRTVTQRVALVFGAEKGGTSDEFAAAADDTVTIPMNPAAESLNVSVSAGIALHARAATNLAGPPTA